MSEIFNAVRNANLEEVKRMVNEDPKCVHIQDTSEWTPLDHAIYYNKLDVARFLRVKGGRPNSKIYCNGCWNPVHATARSGHTATLKWLIEETDLSIDMLKNKDATRKTPLDHAIDCAKLETAKFLWEMGGRPNLEIYRDDIWPGPMHCVARFGCTDILEWIFVKKVLPLSVLNIIDCMDQTPLDFAIEHGKLENAALLRRLPVYSGFLAMQRAKRDYQCVLRKLPNELLDMVVDVAAARFHLKVAW